MRHRFHTLYYLMRDKSFFLGIVSVEVVTAGVVNGSQLDKMGNFSVELNKRAQIIIPTDSLAGLGIGTNGTS